jgi:hypothetical protein
MQEKPMLLLEAHQLTPRRSRARVGDAEAPAPVTARNLPGWGQLHSLQLNRQFG